MPESKNMKSHKIFILMIGIILIILAAFIYYLSIRSSRKELSGKHNLRVVTTLFPLYDFARIVGGDKVDVILLLPPGVEPHSFEPKPKDVVLINQADVFVYTGKSMEVWVDDIIRGVNNNKLLILDTSKGIKMIKSQLDNKSNYSNSNDPHYWLDFENATKMVDSIVLALIKKDPINIAYYNQNAMKLKKSITDLELRYKLSLSSCKSRDIIYAGHYAFGYLAKRYKLKYIAAMGVSPNAEPTANDLAALVRQIKSVNTKYIYYEELSSPKIAETLSNETQTKMLLLNAGHNVSLDQLRQGISFLTIMENNLTNLKIGLSCQ
jgi:zinc transport system substrate-binding protein